MQMRTSLTQLLQSNAIKLDMGGKKAGREREHCQESSRIIVDNRGEAETERTLTVCFDWAVTIPLFLLTRLTAQNFQNLITGSIVSLPLRRQEATAGTDDKTWTPHRHGEIKVTGFLFLNYWTLAVAG